MSKPQSRRAPAALAAARKYPMHRIQVVFEHADALDASGIVDGYIETCRFRDAANSPARRYLRANSNEIITWFSDRPFIFFPEVPSSWAPPVGTIHPMLFSAGSKRAAFGSVRDSSGTANEMVKLMPLGNPKDELRYLVLVGLRITPIEEAKWNQPLPAAIGEAPIIIRATVVLQGRGKSRKPAQTSMP